MLIKPPSQAVFLRIGYDAIQIVLLVSRSMAQLFLFSFYVPLKLKVVDAIGKRLRSERKRLSLTQKQLADKSGILERSISDYECDKSDPSVRNWRALAGAGVDISYVLLGIPTPFEHSIYNRSKRLSDDLCKPRHKVFFAWPKEAGVFGSSILTSA